MSRRERDEARLAVLESDYEALLRTALAECAGGRWGLFGQNDHLRDDPRYRPTVVDDLYALADHIERERTRLGWEAFPLHGRFDSLRGRADENTPGEPRIAARLLEELGWAKAG